jgi:hypothetical protein
VSKPLKKVQIKINSKLEKVDHIPWACPGEHMIFHAVGGKVSI